MADGKTHFASNVILGAAMTALAVVYAPEAVAPVAAGSVIGAFITPDMDLEVKTHSEAVLRQVPVVGIVFQAAWYGYAILHRHRGYSHHFIIGTLGRIAYSALILAALYFWTFGLVAFFDGQTDTLRDVAAAWLGRERSVYALAAWWAQDCLYLLLDAFVKG